MMPGRSVDISVDDIWPGLRDFGCRGRMDNHIFVNEAFRQYIFLVLLKFRCFLILHLQLSQVLLDIGNRRFHSLNLALHIVNDFNNSLKIDSFISHSVNFSSFIAKSIKQF